MRKLAQGLGALIGVMVGSCTHAVNMAYVEVNTNHFENARCYLTTPGRMPFFQMASIFAANINGESPNQPAIYLNPEVRATLASDQIENMHHHGLKVLVTLLGNHQNAGWSCMTDPVAAQHFADNIVSLLNQYNIDGIDIDDEYSTCATNTYSMIMMAQAIKEHPGFKGKLLTKALYADSHYFRATYRGHRLSEYLDYGWEMSYGGGDMLSRLRPYQAAGMPLERLTAGVWAGSNYPDPSEYGRIIASNQVAGAMIYDVTKYSRRYLAQVQRGMNNTTTIEIEDGCLA